MDVLTGKADIGSGEKAALIGNSFGGEAGEICYRRDALIWNIPFPLPTEEFERRNLSAGQRAMARAMLKPEGEQGKRTDLESKPLADLQEVSASQVSRARFVARHDEALAQSVMNDIDPRHLTKGQRAMAVAMMYPEPAKTRRKGSGPLETKELASLPRFFLRPALSLSIQSPSLTPCLPASSHSTSPIRRR